MFIYFSITKGKNNINEFLKILIIHWFRCSFIHNIASTWCSKQSHAQNLRLFAITGFASTRYRNANWIPANHMPIWWVVHSQNAVQAQRAACEDWYACSRGSLELFCIIIVSARVSLDGVKRPNGARGPNLLNTHCNDIVHIAAISLPRLWRLNLMYNSIYFRTISSSFNGSIYILIRTKTTKKYTFILRVIMKYMTHDTFLSWILCV